MLAPPPGLRSYESLQLLCDLVSPGGVLSMTVVGGCDEEMLTLLQDLVRARVSTRALPNLCPFFSSPPSILVPLKQERIAEPTSLRRRR